MHTKEPWRPGPATDMHPNIKPDSITNKSKQHELPIAVFYSGKEDRDRALLCVNACQGISDKDLKNGIIARIIGAQINDEPLEERLLTKEEAADLLSVSPTYLRKCSTKDQYNIPTTKVDGIIKYKLTDIQKFKKRKKAEMEKTMFNKILDYSIMSLGISIGLIATIIMLILYQILPKSKDDDYIH